MLNQTTTTSQITGKRGMASPILIHYLQIVLSFPNVRLGIDCLN
jgi:hypothetical protein